MPNTSRCWVTRYALTQPTNCRYANLHTPSPGSNRPHDTLEIAGFRKNADSVTSFILSEAGDAYAANSRHGDAKNTGIICTVICPLDDPQAKKQPDAFPADNGYTPPPQ